MTNTAIQIVAAGGTCGLAAVAAFTGAIRETFRLEQLRQVYDPVVAEPVPDKLTEFLKGLE